MLKWYKEYPIKIDITVLNRTIYTIFSYIHSIHVCFFYLHLPQKSTIHAGKYSIPMDPIGYIIFLYILSIYDINLGACS